MEDPRSRTAMLPPRPGIITADPRVDENVHVHTDDPAWASGAVSRLAPILLQAPAGRGGSPGPPP
ncbi:hypothetical protein ACQPZP_33270 [Spirillospora sp. CA-142024]|uniref:hypothetical protein n=1 Tax=Spirillospora sp. CA-142024 TaxID=3240036 RepID=UPI003D946E92